MFEARYNASKVYFMLAVIYVRLLGALSMYPTVSNAQL